MSPPGDPRTAKNSGFRPRRSNSGCATANEHSTTSSTARRPSPSPVDGRERDRAEDSPTGDATADEQRTSRSGVRSWTPPAGLEGATRGLDVRAASSRWRTPRMPRRVNRPRHGPIPDTAVRRIKPFRRSCVSHLETARAAAERNLPTIPTWNVTGARRLPELRAPRARTPRSRVGGCGKKARHPAHQRGRVDRPEHRRRRGRPDPRGHRRAVETRRGALWGPGRRVSSTRLDE